MRKRGLRVLAGLYLIIGVVFIFSSFSGLTGLAIAENIGIVKGFSFYFGITLILIGCLVLIAAQPQTEEIRNKEGHLIKIIKTEHFQRAIRGHDTNIIDKAITKIGTGLGNEEKLRTGGYSIRVSKAGRIVFEKNPNGAYILEDYTPDHRY